MVAQGAAHAIFDIDICYRRTPENLERLCRALQPWHPQLRGAPPDVAFQLDVKTLKNGLNFTLSTDLGPLDLLDEVSGLGGYDDALQESEIKTLDNSACRVLSIPALLRTKRASVRNKDMNAIQELQALLDLKERIKEP